MNHRPSVRVPSFLALVCCVATLALLSTPPAFAQTSDEAPVFRPVDPAKAGFDAERLAKLDELFAADVSEGKMVGCVALVARDADVVYCRTFGDRDRAAGEVMTEDTIFRIYSMSKPITSVAVMMLVERGKIELDAPVAKYLPELARLKVAAPAKEGASGVESEDGGEVELERPLTIRDLLRHTSGLTYGFFGDTAVDRRYREAGILSRQSDLAELVTALAEIPLLYQPGTRFHYSVSTDVLGRVVEVVSEQTLGAFLDENVFQPLDMKDTFFTVPANKQDRFAAMYRPGRDGELVPAAALSSWRFLNGNRFSSGGGGLCSTTRDYLRFCSLLMNEGELGGTRLLKPETVREMTRDQLREVRGTDRGFQFGLGVSIDGEGRYGWGGAAGTRFWIDPVHKVIGLFMVQINPYRGADYEGEMKRIVYGALAG